MLTIITGTPCTGKTEISKKLGKILNTSVIHLTEFVKHKKISLGFDRKMKSLIVDLEKLENKLKKEIKTKHTKEKNLIIEGHLACEIPLMAKYVFVLRCNPNELEKRMKKQRYSKNKINENLLAEMLDYCTQNAMVNYPNAKILEIETHGKTSDEIARQIKRTILGKKIHKLKFISYQKELKDFLKLS